MSGRFATWLLGFFISFAPVFTGVSQTVNDISANQVVPVINPQEIIVVGGDQAYPPYEFIDKGKPSGFNVDLLRAVANVMGLNIEIRLMPWNVAMKELSEGDIQMISGMYLDKERFSQFIFSTPHSMVTPAVFVKDDSPIRNFEDIKGQRVGVQTGDISHSMLLNSGMDLILLEVTDPLDALIMLSKDVCDAVMLSSKLQGLYHLNKYNLKHIKSLDLNFQSRSYCFASTPDNEALIYKLNEGLSILRNSGEYSRIYDKWFGIYETPTYYKRILWLVLLITGLFILSATWSWSLRKRVKKQIDRIRESEALFTTIFRESPSIILISDFETGNLLKVNNTFEHASGFMEYEVTGKSIFDTGLLDNNEDRDRMISILKNKSTIRSREFVFRIKDGARMTCLVSASRIQYLERPAVILVITDITTRKKMETEFLAAKLKAEESDRLKSAFLANMSHQIRTPMNAIVGFVELLVNNNLNDEKKKEYVGHVKTNSYQLLDIITDIINISKIDSGTETISITEVDVDKVMSRIEQQYKIQAEDKRLKLTRLNNHHPFRIKTDNIKLSQVLSNLVDNAIKYTNNGFVEFGYNINENQIQFTIRDSGCGIPENKLSSIFSRFVTMDELTDEETTGTGLGLAIAKAYTELLGGTIAVESAEGQGTCFTVNLPLTEKQ
jgi:two-component system, NarL family, sensor histidine kinase EvgS